MATGKNIGYIRVSTVEQNTDRQLDGIQLDKVFTDKCSGKDTKRPGLAALLDYIRDGDTLYVHAMDRLGRSLTDLLQLVAQLTGQGITVVFVKNNMCFSGTPNATDQLMLAVLGAVAEFERTMLRERQAEGIAKAKAKGVYKGRQPVLTPAQVAMVQDRLRTGTPKAALARELGVSRSALYAHLRTLPDAAPAPA
jgi:DNA invertase Pin-like site-specific DNA recombinase